MKRASTALVLLLALALSGCGSGKDEAASTTNDGPSLPSGRTVEETLAHRVSVPDVQGMSPQKAVDVLATVGFTVTFDGDGDEVTAQFPAPGTSVEAGSEVELTITATGPTGTRDDPFPFGTPLAGSGAGDVEEVTVTLGAAQWGADAAIMAENQFNDPAPAGSSYVLLPVTITNVASTEPVAPRLAFDIVYVAPDGRSYDHEYASIPNDLSDVGDLYQGGSATGNLAFLLPTTSQGGVWAVACGRSDPVFVAAS